MVCIISFGHDYESFSFWSDLFALESLCRQVLRGCVWFFFCLPTLTIVAAATFLFFVLRCRSFFCSCFCDDLTWPSKLSSISSCVITPCWDLAQPSQQKVSIVFALPDCRFFLLSLLLIISSSLLISRGQQHQNIPSCRVIPVSPPEFLLVLFLYWSCTADLEHIRV